MSFIRHSSFFSYLMSVIILLSALRAGATDSGANEFEQANKLYEQGKFKEAIGAYERLLSSGVQAPAIYFNLGNAWYKSGQNGRAVASYLRAERLAPRDPSIRFNLDFVRRKISGQSATVSFLQRGLRRLSINEWALAAAAAFWIWFLLLALRESRPAWRLNLRGYTLWTGIITAILTLSLSAALYERSETKTAVIIVPEATVRYGPLEESQTFYKLPDGSEVRVVDQKVNSPQDVWLQVEDASGRPGWLKREQVLTVFSELSKRKTV